MRAWLIGLLEVLRFYLQQAEWTDRIGRERSERMRRSGGGKENGSKR